MTRTTVAFALSVTFAGLIVRAAAAGDPPSTKGAPDAGASSESDAGGPADSGGRITATPPDPDPPMKERVQWIFDLRYDRSDVSLLGVHTYELAKAAETPRAMGRFAIELFEGKTLIERVRFDFPLLGDGEPKDAGYRTPPSFAAKLSTRIGVMFPATSRGTRLELWDRMTDRRWALPWPPVDTRPPQQDGGI